MPKHVDAPGDSPRDLTVDSELVRTLAALLAETGLSEIEYAVGERRIRVARSLAAMAAPAATAPPPAAAANGAAPAQASLAAPARAVQAPIGRTVHPSPQTPAPALAQLRRAGARRPPR